MVIDFIEELPVDQHDRSGPQIVSPKAPSPAVATALGLSAVGDGAPFQTETSRKERQGFDLRAASSR